MYRKLGKNAYLAALDGAKEVWGAVFASTATTVAVFLPVIFMQEEAGQLFRDIAIATIADFSEQVPASQFVHYGAAERALV